MSAETEYFYAKDGERHGPVALGQLRAMIVSGDLSRLSKVWRKGMAEWRRASDIEEIADSIPPELQEDRSGVESDQNGDTQKTETRAAGYAFCYLVLASIGWLAWAALDHGGANRFFKESAVMLTLVFASVVLPMICVYWWFLPSSGNQAKDRAKKTSIVIIVCEEVAVVFLLILETDDQHRLMLESIWKQPIEQVALIWCVLILFPVAVVYPLTMAFFGLVWTGKVEHIAEGAEKKGECL